MDRNQETPAQPETGEAEGQLPALPEVNEVVVVGRLVNAPKTRLVTGDKKMARFMLAVPRTFRNNAGQPSKDTAYVPIVAWRAIAQQAETLGKGDGVRVEGRLRTWQSPEGQKYRWEVEASLFEVLHKRPAAPAAAQQQQMAGV